MKTMLKMVLHFAYNLVIKKYERKTYAQKKKLKVYDYFC